MRIRNTWWMPWLLVAALSPAQACFLFSDDNGGEKDAGGQGQGDAGPWNDDTCYMDTKVGCSEISWTDVQNAIDILYALDDQYAGYTKDEALDIAHTVYENGVYPEAYLRILDVENLGSGRWRAFVVVTGADGLPAHDLSKDDFQLALDGGVPAPPDTATTLGEIDTGSTVVDLSVAVDDSGSILDCDANFVALGLAYLFETLPPVYTAELVKFESIVHLAQERTSDGDLLANAMLSYCTSRGSTALWDGVARGISDLPGESPLRAVVVFTDGLENASSHSYDDVATEARAAGAPVFSLGLGFADIFTLLNLARDTGGGFVYINSGERILDGFKTITDFILNTYVVEWTSDAPFGGVDVTVQVSATDTVTDHIDMP